MNNFFNSINNTQIINSTLCSETIIFKEITIYQPSLIPTCILAAIIGLICGSKIYQKNVVGHVSYCISFLMFGCMMSFAMIVNCFFQINQMTIWGLFFALFDVGLTSCIALSFFWNGLVDVGLIKECPRTYILMFISYFAIFGGWVYALLTQWINGFIYLYVLLIVVSCSLYLIMKIVNILYTKNFSGLGWIFLGGLSGGFGLLAIAYPSLSNWFCQNLPLSLNGAFWWFILSDVSMFTLYKYFITSKTQNEEKTLKSSSSSSSSSQKFKKDYKYYSLKSVTTMM